jgi:hypothetical protein
MFIECYQCQLLPTPQPEYSTLADELLPLWAFKDEHAARQSSEAIWTKFVEYRDARDFVGCDVARKYLQMGCTRARRYAKHKGGNKSLPLTEEDAVKARSADIFEQKWREAVEDVLYQDLKLRHKRRKR